MSALPAYALSVRQPWAHLIVAGLKDIENRSWPTKYRGEVLIHASKKADIYAWAELQGGRHPATGSRWTNQQGNPLPAGGALAVPMGGIVGVAEIVDCVSVSSSPWFVGEFGFVIRNARPLPFRPLKGALGFFRVTP